MQNDLRRCTSVLIDWWMYVMLSGSADWLFLSHFYFIQKEARLSKFIYEGNNGHFNLAELVILVIGGKLFLENTETLLQKHVTVFANLERSGNSLLYFSVLI